MDAVFNVMPDLHILVIDDGSPDGTAKLVKARMENDSRIHLIEREGKLGLGTAYCRGFAYAIEQGFELVYQMDADFSHDPKDLARFAVSIQDHDLVIGSRYKQGVKRDQLAYE